MSTADKISALRAEWLESAGRSFDRYMSEWGESPIENLLIAEMLICSWRYPDQGPWARAYESMVRLGIKKNANILAAESSPFDYCVVQPEVTCDHKVFRLDFAFVMGDERFAVELDGHDFHERTKDQARKDRSRDRLLTTHGWRVFRFTGSEVYADPYEVLVQLSEAARALSPAAIYQTARDPMVDP